MTAKGEVIQRARICEYKTFEPGSVYDCSIKSADPDVTACPGYTQVPQSGRGNLKVLEIGPVVRELKTSKGLCDNNEVRRVPPALW